MTKLDLLDLYGRASEWTVGNVRGAAGQLLNHMLDTQRYFLDTARGLATSPPSPHPPELLGDDPVAAFEDVRAQMLSSFGEDGVIERTGLSLGIAFSDQLLHGWDLANATGQDATMPDGLAEADYEIIHGRFTDEQRKGIFKPEVAVGPRASAQDKLLAYTGRDPR